MEGLVPPFVEVIGGKLVGGIFSSPLFPRFLNRVKAVSSKVFFKGCTGIINSKIFKFLNRGTTLFNQHLLAKSKKLNLQVKVKRTSSNASLLRLFILEGYCSYCRWRENFFSCNKFSTIDHFWRNIPCFCLLLNAALVSIF